MSHGDSPLSPQLPQNVFGEEVAFPTSFETKCTIDQGCETLRTRGSAQDLDLGVWPTVLRVKMESAKDRSAARLQQMGSGLSTCSTDYESRAGMKRPSSDGGGDYKHGARGLAFVASPRAACGPLDWASPDRPSVLPLTPSPEPCGGLPLTPVGSEGNLAALGCESPLCAAAQPCSSPGCLFLCAATACSPPAHNPHRCPRCRHVFGGGTAGSPPLLSLLDSRTSLDGYPGPLQSPAQTPGTPTQLGASFLAQETFSLCPPRKKRVVDPDEDGEDE